MADRPMERAATAGTYPFGVLSLAPLTMMLTVLLHSTIRRHPDILDRLGEHTEKRFGLEVTGLPLAFVLAPRSRGPTVAAVPRLSRGIDVRIAGRLPHLLGLIDGAYDGDALFFSRRLAIEGDIEAALALRNALDEARLDLAAEAAALIPPLGWPVERLARAMLALARRWDTEARSNRGPVWS